VAEKRGVVKVFDSLTDTSPEVFADLRTNVYNFWDRGLLGMVLHPSFPTNPSVYVLYTYDHELGSLAPAPRWGAPGVDSDPCPTPPGLTADGCVVSGRLSRLTASGNQMSGPEQVLIEDWCQQYPGHSVGALEFGAYGALYATGGDGASFNFADWGQDGAPLNPCGDPPGGVGGTLTPPTAEGGALRSQDLRTAGDPVTLDGAVIRVDPATGAALPTNPLAANPDQNAKRIIAYGLRNPFRFTFRPGTNELWLGDVGWNTWEEINRIPSTTDAVVENFGWPCYEGNGRQGGYDGANLSICETLYGQAGAVTAPYHAYNHSNRVVEGETCPTGSSSIAGMQFEFSAAANSYPAEYDGALFFADYSRDCIWMMPKGADSRPVPGQVRTFVAGAANPEPGDGAGRRPLLRRLRRRHDPPHPVLQHQPAADRGRAGHPHHRRGATHGQLQRHGLQRPRSRRHPGLRLGPRRRRRLRRRLDGPGDLHLHRAGNLCGDAQGDRQPRSVRQRHGADRRRQHAPTPTIATPAAGTTWKVGDVISFSGSATDQQDGTIPASGRSWKLIQQHCPTNRHQHEVQTFSGVASGSFTAPDHVYPSFLELTLSASDSGGLTGTRTVRLDPRTVVLSFQTTPGGLRLAVNGTQSTATFTRTVIVGSSNTVSAVTPQTKGGKSYSFASWSDGGAQTHTIVAPATAATYTARFRSR